MQMSCQQLAASTGRAHSCNAISGDQPKVRHGFTPCWTPPIASRWVVGRGPEIRVEALGTPREPTNGLRQTAALFSNALLHTTHGDISAASQAEIRGGSRPGLPDTAGIRSHPSHRPQSANGFHQNASGPYLWEIG